MMHPAIEVICRVAEPWQTTRELLGGTHEELRTYVEKLSDAAVKFAWNDWDFWRREDQMEPEGDWQLWLVMAGRG
jgi:hypothetical protein